MTKLEVRLCQHCGKRCYTKHSAVGVALRESAKHGVALRPYPAHGAWHLTKQPSHTP